MTDKPNLARLEWIGGNAACHHANVNDLADGLQSCTSCGAVRILAALSADLPADVAGVVEEARNDAEWLRQDGSHDEIAERIDALIALATAQAAQIAGLEAQLTNTLFEAQCEGEDKRDAAYSAAEWQRRAEAAETALAAERAKVARLVEAADTFAVLIADARAEAEKAMRKFPQPNYVISKIAEEAGEVVKAAIHAAEGRETAENLRGEMKQLIAMLYRLWIEGDEVHGLASVDAAITEVGQ